MFVFLSAKLQGQIVAEMRLAKWEIPGFSGCDLLANTVRAVFKPPPGSEEGEEKCDHYGG